MNLSNYEILWHCLGVTEFPMPTPYVALSNIDPSELEDGDLTGEPDGAGYERQPATFSVNGAVASNTEDIIHTATGDWGILLSMAITDAAVDGNMLLYSAITPAAINQNEHKFPTGSLTVSIDGGRLSDYLSQRVLQHLLGIEAFPMPTATYLAIMDKNLQEVSGGGYVRQLCTFDIVSENSLALSETVFFPMATSNWSNEACFLAIIDDSDNILFFNELVPHIEIKTGSELYFTEEGLVLSVR